MPVGMIVRCAVAVLLLAVGVPFVVYDVVSTAGGRPGMLALAETGVRVEAVAGAAQSLERSGDVTWVVAVRYVHGGERDGWLFCGDEARMCPPEGSTVPLWVDPARPARFTDGRGNVAYLPQEGGGGVGLLGLVPAVVGAGLLVDAVRRRRAGR